MESIFKYVSVATGEFELTVLHHIGELFRTGLSAIPLPVVRLLFVGTLLLVLLWVSCLPNERLVSADGIERDSKSLKRGAMLALSLQILVYSFL